MVGSLILKIVGTKTVPPMTRKRLDFAIKAIMNTKPKVAPIPPRLIQPAATSIVLILVAA